MTKQSDDLETGIPEQLQKTEFEFVKVEPDSKKAATAWQNPYNRCLYNDAEIAAWLNHGYNVALYVDNPLVVLDIDGADVYDEIAEYLPDTFTVESQSRDGYHLYYESYVNLQAVRGNPKISLPDGDVEVRIPGKHLIQVPPSEVEGRQYRVHQDEDINTLDFPRPHLYAKDTAKRDDPLKKAVKKAYGEGHATSIFDDKKDRKKVERTRDVNHFTNTEVEDKRIENVLDHIDNEREDETSDQYLDYHKWFDVIIATYDACNGDVDKAERQLKNWSPEEQENEYRNILEDLEVKDDGITWATALHHAKQDNDYEQKTIEYEKDGVKHVIITRSDETWDYGVFYYECPRCQYVYPYTQNKQPYSPNRCGECGWEDGDFNLVKKKYPTSYTGIEKSKQPDLLKQVYDELSEHHKMDDKQKLAAFIVACSSALPQSSDHQSAALKGDSSSGKDNLIKSVLKHIPDERHWFVTRATQAAMEDEVHKYDIMAFSEINKHREDGANNEITETFKQAAEGGISSKKKDPSTGYQNTLENDSEQKTLFYGTTETQKDKELETRYVVIPIKGSREKNHQVIKSISNTVSDPIKQLEKQKNTNWVKDMIRSLDPNLEVTVPYANATSHKQIEVDDSMKPMFDLNKERIKRDYGRLMSLTKTITWLHQRQRQSYTVRDQEFLVSQPCDFYAALQIFGEFFQLTYSGLDHRLQNTIDRMEELQGEHSEEITEKVSSDSLENLDNQVGADIDSWLLFSKLQDDPQLPNSRTTLYKRIYGEDDGEGSLSDLGKVKTTKATKSTGGTISLVKPVFKSVSNRCSTLFTNWPFNAVQRVVNTEMNSGIEWTNNRFDNANLEFVDRDVVLPDTVKVEPEDTYANSQIEQSDAEQSESPESTHGDDQNNIDMDDLDTDLGEQPDTPNYQNVIATVDDLDDGGGAPVEDVIRRFDEQHHDKAEQIIEELQLHNDEGQNRLLNHSGRLEVIQ